MADKRFFKLSGPFDLEEIARISESKIAEGADSSKVINDVAPLGTARDSDISFLDNKKYIDDFQNTNAGACFVSEKLASKAPKGTICLISSNPYKSYALAARYFYPKTEITQNISDRAIVKDTAKIGDNCIINAGAYIGDNVIIGDNCIVNSNAVIEDNVELGNECVIGSNTTISHAILGNQVVIYPGACIGQRGFGFAIDPKGFVNVPQLGRVIIEDDVEVGANSTIDRGAGPDTIIGRGTRIDNLVQIGHNVKVGMGCVIVAQVGISGSSEIGDFVMVGGQTGIAGHLKIGSGAKIAAQSGVMRDVPAGESYIGSPAVPAKQFMRQVATLSKMVKKKKDSK